MPIFIETTEIRNIQVLMTRRVALDRGLLVESDCGIIDLVARDTRRVSVNVTRLSAPARLIAEWLSGPLLARPPRLRARLTEAERAVRHRGRVVVPGTPEHARLLAAYNVDPSVRDERDLTGPDVRCCPPGDVAAWLERLVERLAREGWDVVPPSTTIAA